MNGMAKSFDETLKKGYKGDVLSNVRDMAMDIVDTIFVIPILSTVRKFYDITKNFQLERLWKKLVRFLFNVKETTVDEREKFMKELSEKSKDEASEVLLDMIDRLDNVNKVDIMTNLMKARIKEELSIENFIRLCGALERIPFSDLGELKNYTKDYFDPYSTDIILGSGILTNTAIGDDNEEGRTNLYRLNQLGGLMLRYGLQIDIDFEVEYVTSLRMAIVSKEKIDKMLGDFSFVAPQREDTDRQEA